MKRVYKFRGQTPQGEWVYGFYAIDGDGTYIICDEENKQRGEWYKIIPDSAGQFTGLFDKNGNEIYEGDIVKFSYGYRNEFFVGQVATNKYYNFCLKVSEAKIVEKWGRKFRLCTEFHIENAVKGEIIGNVTDTPDELLI
jgi:uncharacterized phage protein (TIGR01671 family)